MELLLQATENSFKLITVLKLKFIVDPYYSRIILESYGEKKISAHSTIQFTNGNVSVAKILS